MNMRAYVRCLRFSDRRRGKCGRRATQDGFGNVAGGRAAHFPTAAAREACKTRCSGHVLNTSPKAPPPRRRPKR